MTATHRVTSQGIKKIGYTMPISELSLLLASGFPQRGYWETVPLTDEDRAAHARAVAARDEIESNPWVELSGYEYDFHVRPLEPKRRFIATETSEEWLERWTAAGKPVTFANDALRTRLSARIMASLVTPDPIITGGAA